MECKKINFHSQSFCFLLFKANSVILFINKPLITSGGALNSSFEVLVDGIKVGLTFLKLHFLIIFGHVYPLGYAHQTLLIIGRITSNIL